MFDRDKKNGSGAGEASLIDTDMRITGSVTSVGDIILAGSVDGEIKCRNLYVEDQAVLTGSVEAKETVVSGQVNGEVNAETLRITHTGVFDGVIKTGGIKVENGAHVTGKFRKRRR